MTEYGREPRSAVEPPDSRVYRHRKCGGLTRVWGGRFLKLANPFGSPPMVGCCACHRSDRLDRFEWADTGEDLASYRVRLRGYEPIGRRWFFRSMGLIVGGPPGLIVGFPLGMLGKDRKGFKKAPWWAPGILGGVIGAGGGALMAALFLTPLLMKRLWGLDYRGER